MELHHNMLPVAKYCHMTDKTGYIKFVFRLSKNSEAGASELLENREEMLLLYYTHSDECSIFYSSITHYCVTRRKSVDNAWL